MKRSISHAALAIALSIGMVGAAATSEPAYAAAKKKAKGPTGEYSEGFIGAYQPLVAKSEAEGANGAALVGEAKALAAVSQSPDEKQAAGGLIYRIGAMAQDRALQQQGIEMMIGSGKVAGEQAPLIYFTGGQLAYANKEYAKATQYLEQAKTLGYTENDIDYLLVRSMLDGGQSEEGFATLTQLYDTRRAAGQAVPEGLAFEGLRFAVDAQNKEEGFKWALRTLQTDTRPQVRGQAYKILAAYSPYADEEQLDLMRLMFRDDGLSESRQYVDYLALINPLRRPAEAKQLLDSYDGWPSSNVLISDARTTASDRYASVRKELDADSTGATGDDALNIGDVYLGYGASAEAETMYRAALSANGTNARALTGLGIALADQGKWQEAKDTFGKITTGNRSTLAKAWMAYIDLKLETA